MSVEWHRMTAARRAFYVRVLEKFPLREDVRALKIANLPQTGDVYKVHKRSIGQKIGRAIRKKVFSKDMLRFGGMLGGLGVGLFAHWATRIGVGAVLTWGRKSKYVGKKLRRAFRPFSYGFAFGSSVRAAQWIGRRFEPGAWNPTPQGIADWFKSEHGVKPFPGTE